MYCNLHKSYIEALLGTIPENFYATLSDYSIYKAEFDQLSPKIRDFFVSRNVDQSTFTYLFAKHDPVHKFTIEGQAYSVDLDQELILDHWELYPDWYRKKAVNLGDDTAR